MKKVDSTELAFAEQGRVTPGVKVEKACLGKSCLGEILEVEEVFASWWAVGVAWKGFQAQKQHEQRLEA